MRTIQGTLCTLIAAAVCSAAATEASRIALHIESQPVRLALKDLGEQTGLQIMFRAEDLDRDEITAPKISGELSPQEALDKMLKNTEFHYRFVNPNTVYVSKDMKSGQKAAIEEQEKWARLAWLTTASAGESDSDSSSLATTSSSPSAGLELEEVIVTAQRRKENLQEVPISISVFRGETLDSSTASGLVEVLQAAPGYDSITDLYEGGAVGFSVRGVSAAQIAGAGSGPVAFYLDGVPYGFLRSAMYPDPNVYDLNQIEVLSGPQGTLYGAGSVNGVIRVLTHDANADEFEFKARGEVSAVEDGGENWAGDIAVNVPIIEGVLGIRATVGFRDDAGWVDTVQAPVDYGYSPLPAERRDANDSQQESYRLKVHFQPAPTLAVDLTAWRTEYESGVPEWAQADRTTIALLDQTQGQQFTTYSARIANEFSGFTLTSTTSYVDFLNGGVTSGEPINTAAPFPVTVDERWTSEVFSQEFNLVSTGEGAWRWSAGAFYRDAEESRTSTYYTYGLLGAVDASLTDEYGDSSLSYAVFGEVAYDLTPELELAVGARYFNDEQTLTLFKDYERTDLGTFLPAGTENDSSFSATTPRVVLTWTPTDEQMFYASYAQGFRSGLAQEPNTQTGAPGGFPPAEPDLLINYEVGAKGSILSGGLSYEAAVFFMDWQDVQQVGAVVLQNGYSASSAIFNAPSASGIGASFGLRARPIEGLELSANVSWNDLTIDETFTSTVGIFQEGERLMFSPETTINAGIQYEWALGGDFLARIGLDGSYRSPQTTRTTAGTTAESESIYIANLAFTLESPFGWKAKLFADNATDEYNTSAPGLFPSWSPRQHPRVVGLQLAYKF